MIVFASPGHRRERTAIALTDCNLNFLEKEVVDAIACHHPILRQRIQAFSTRRQMDLSKKIRAVSENAAARISEYSSLQCHRTNRSVW